MRPLKVLLLIVVMQSAHAQRFLTGQVIDAETRQPIPFSAIRIVSGVNNSGVITNADGDFQIPADLSAKADSVVISCIGYKTRKLPFTVLHLGIWNTLTLQKTTYMLREVTVEEKRRGRLSARRIVRFALENLSANYPANAFDYIAYYRDYQRSDDQYLNLNEAVIYVRDAGFTTNDYDSTRIAVVQYQADNGFRRDSAMAVAYTNTVDGKFIPGATLFASGGNELAILRIHDPIRNSQRFSFSFFNRFTKDFLSNHSFQLNKVIDFNNKKLYQIGFKTPDALVPGYSAVGEIFIERGNFAIHKIQYSVVKGDQPFFGVTVEYAAHEGKMYLNYLSFNNFFYVRDPKDFIVKDILLDRSNRTLTVTFNNEPDVSCEHRDNYDIKFKGQNVMVEAVQLNRRNRSVVVHVANDALMRSSSSDISRYLKVNFQNMKDLSGRVLNVITTISVNQFREVFMQRLFPTSTLFQSWVDKRIPLERANVETISNATDYWMNTPLKQAIR